VLASDKDDALLLELKPKDIDRSSPHSECMDGTRQDIFSRTEEWLNDFRAPNILWIKGHPGAGKSAIASSLVERLFSSRRLGASFFFQRDNAATTTCHALWRMVAFELSRQYPSVRKSLVAKLRADEIRPTTINTENLFRRCIFDPLAASVDIPAGRLPVIVIDALDECGGLEGQASTQREALMKTLFNWSQMSSKFKLIVTSRGEADIEQTFQTTNHVPIIISTGDEVEMNSSNDIREYLRQEFQTIASQYPMSLNADWPGESTIDNLTKKAAGLFIWAKTIIRFIKMGPPKIQLKSISEGGSVGGMSDLYSKLLEVAFPAQVVAYTEVVRSIFATVILAKTPLSPSAITRLLNIESNVMEDVCKRMTSVLDTQVHLRVSHQSFSDFLLDENACPRTFHIKPNHWNQALSIACLNMMKTDLKFNICGLNSSYLRNSEVSDLASRVESCIHPELSYSCLFWTEHLSGSEHNDKLYSGIQDFLDNRFLYWLEVLSLCRRMNQTSGILKVLINWMLVSYITSILQNI
jgi:hypothetical protein